jgi:regulator of sirC expression with transglutaminase-like and TPR domain
MIFEISNAHSSRDKGTIYDGLSQDYADIKDVNSFLSSLPTNHKAFNINLTEDNSATIHR